MTEKEFIEKGITLSFEFDRYLMNHPEIAEKIPEGANIMFILEDDAEFSDREKALLEEVKKTGEPVVIVKVETLHPPLESRLVNPRLELVSSI